RSASRSAARHGGNRRRRLLDLRGVSGATVATGRDGRPTVVAAGAAAIAGAAALSSAFAHRDGRAAGAAATHPRCDRGGPRRRLLRIGGIVRIREGALRCVAASGRAAVVARSATGARRRRGRGLWFLLPYADRPLYRPRRRASRPTSARRAARSSIK